MKNPVIWFFRILCVAFLCINIYLEHSGKFIVDPEIKLILAAIFIALLTVAVNPFKGSVNKKTWLWIMFLYYLWVLANLLFFDLGFGRHAALSGINLKPFYTIRNYLTAYELGNITKELVVINLIGNLAAFAPMAIFLPALFRVEHNFLVFFLTIFLMVATVEGVQYFTGTGSCDVDDLILNVVGAMVIWVILLPWRIIMKYKGRWQ